MTSGQMQSYPALVAQAQPAFAPKFPQPVTPRVASTAPHLLSSASQRAQRLTTPLQLILGQKIGVERHRHYEIDFLWRRCTHVEQKTQVAILDAPAVYAMRLPSTTVHSFRPYVLDEGNDQEASSIGQGRYRWRYLWVTHCGSFALQVATQPHEVLTWGTRIKLYVDTPFWGRMCRLCAGKARKHTTKTPPT
jgi:hypothetical protein